MGLNLILGLLLSAAIGFSLGLIGGGGSIITVPVLVYVIGVEPHQAIGMSLAVVGITSLIGAALHSRRDNVRWRTGLIFGGSGVFGAFFGARLTHLFSPQALLLLFAALMIVISLLMLKKRPHENNGNWTREFSLGKAIVAGLGVGALTGFLGVGGGFLIVPALALFGGLAMREAVGTSLVVIAINCAAGLLGQMQHGGGIRRADDNFGRGAGGDWNAGGRGAVAQHAGGTTQQRIRRFHAGRSGFPGGEELSGADPAGDGRGQHVRLIIWNRP